MGEQLDALFGNTAELPPPAEPLDGLVLPSGGAVYAFTDEHDHVLQTVGTQSLRRSVLFRLVPPDDEKRRRRVDLRALARRIRWTPTYSVFETYWVYLNLARRLRPAEYRNELAFGPVWFAGVDPAARFPRWQVETVLHGAAVSIGPFGDRARCTAFVELLEDLFDLCRRYDILVQSPDGRPCVYFEMGKCPAACDGSVSLEVYREMIGWSVEFACGNHERRLRQMEEAMRLAAAERAYERAGRFKEVLARARRVLQNDGRLVPTPREFRFLVVQRAGGTSRVKPFWVDDGAIRVGEPVRLRQVGETLPAWIAGLEQRVPADAMDPVQRSECIWLVSHFLMKGEQAPGLFLRAAQLGDAGELARVIADRFASSARTSENMRDPGSPLGDVDSGA
jgi:excinuclease ABC subunit C